MKIYLLIQARSSSSRLPFKSLLSIDKYFAIELLYKRVKSKKYQTLILTSKDDSDDYFAHVLKRKNIPFVRGNLLNVKERFLNFKKNIHPNDILVRLTGDNLFIDKYLIKLLVRKIIKENKNYVFIGNQYLKIPYGISVEAFRFSQLKKKKNNTPKDMEHVTYSFDKTKENSLKSLKENYKWKKLKCSIDHLENYYDVRKVFQKAKNPATISWHQLCSLLEKNSKNQKKITKNIKLISLKSKHLKANHILNICKLKKQEWKYPLKSQIKHFNKNFNNKDINNMIYKNKKLIGYTILRKKKIKINNLNKNFLLLDTIIIDNRFRNKNLGEILMYFNNNQILRSKHPSILQCKKKHLLFYKKFYWKKINDKNVIFDNKNNKLNLMSFSYY